MESAAARTRGVTRLTESDASLCQVVGGNLQRDFVPWNNADEIFSHLSRYVGKDDVIIGKLHPKKSSGKNIHNNTVSSNTIVFSHSAL